MAKPIVIRIDFEFVDDWWVVTSKDLPGFILADPDKEKLKQGLPETIEMLYSERHGKPCQVSESEYGDARSGDAGNPPPCLLFPGNLLQQMTSSAVA